MSFRYPVQKQMDRIRQVLSKHAVLRALDRNSELKARDAKNSARYFGWDSLFKVRADIWQILVPICVVMSINTA